MREIIVHLGVTHSTKWTLQNKTKSVVKATNEAPVIDIWGSLLQRVEMQVRLIGRSLPIVKGRDEL